MQPGPIGDTLLITSEPQSVMAAAAAIDPTADEHIIHVLRQIDPNSVSMSPPLSAAPPSPTRQPRPPLQMQPPQRHSRRRHHRSRWRKNGTIRIAAGGAGVALSLGGRGNCRQQQGRGPPQRKVQFAERHGAPADDGPAPAHARCGDAQGGRLRQQLPHVSARGQRVENPAHLWLRDPGRPNISSLSVRVRFS